LRLYEVHHLGASTETEREIQNYDAIQEIGLICGVELFPVLDIYAPDGNSRQYSQYPPSSTQVVPGHVGWHNNSGGFSVGSSPPQFYTPDTAHYLRGFPATEGPRAPSALFGSTFVSSVKIEYGGRKVLLFPFSDLSVKSLGTFMLRYRFFDIHSIPQGHTDAVVQAECFGGSFRVYSSKDVPLMGPSTELTKTLALYGIPVHVRETARTRNGHPSTNGKGKKRLKE